MGAAEHRDGLTTSKRDETDETDEADEGDETHVGLHNSRDFAVTARYTTRSRAPRARRRTPGCARAPRSGRAVTSSAPDPIIDFDGRGGRHFRRRRALARKIQQQTPAAQISEITRLLKYTVSRRVTRIFTRDPPRASEIYFTAQSQSQQRAPTSATPCSTSQRLPRRRSNASSTGLRMGMNAFVLSWHLWVRARRLWLVGIPISGQRRRASARPPACPTGTPGRRSL